jgi:GNAT superfamily N-acetyltransferase
MCQVESLVRLGAEDAGEVLTLQRAAYVTEAQAHRDLDLPPLLQPLDEVAAELADREVIAAGWRDSSGRLVAAVRLRVRASAPSVAEVSRLTVVPDRQGQQLGTALLRAVEERLPATVTELHLFTGEHSAGNLRLYDRLGYDETHREQTPAGYALIHLHTPRSPSAGQ